MAITFFAVTVTPSIRDDVLKSRSGHYVAVLIDKADGVMPAGINEVIAPIRINWRANSREPSRRRNRHSRYNHHRCRPTYAAECASSVSVGLSATSRRGIPIRAF